MPNLTHTHPQGQELIHILHLDHNTYTALIRTPGTTPIPFADPAAFEPDQCFSLKRYVRDSKLPLGARAIPTESIPSAPLQVIVLTGFFLIAPMARLQTLEATLVYNPDIDPGPTGRDNIAMIVITQHGYFLQDIDELPSDSPPARDLTPEDFSLPEGYTPHGRTPTPGSGKQTPILSKARVIDIQPKRIAKQRGPRLKLYRIPVDFYNSQSFQGLARPVIELYRILRTFAKIPQGPSLYHYNWVGIDQLCALMKRRREDLLATCRPDTRPEIENIRFSHGSVVAYKNRLCKRGLIYQVVTGKPKPYSTAPPYVSKYLVVVSEDQRFKLIQDANRARRSPP